jgi:adenine-specific DNA-methyltransferase
MRPNEERVAEEFSSVLSVVSSFVAKDGDLIKANLRAACNAGDKALLQALASSSLLKAMFFSDVNGATYFLQDKFLQFLETHEFLHGSFTAFRNKVGLSMNNRLYSEVDDVVISWPYKECILEGGMSKSKKGRDEIFVNPLFASLDANRLMEPKAFKDFRLLDNSDADLAKTPGSSSLLLKGNNLFALATLRRKYSGKVDAIYIDPPYNTGGDEDEFAYNNTFKHSTWYTFMKNRLEIARELLTDSGIIAIAIDHVELLYLGVLADEVFHRDNRLGIITVVHKPEGRNQEKFFGTSTEFMLVYAKDEYAAQFNKVALDEDKAAKYDKSDSEGSYKWANYLRAGGGDANLRVNKTGFWYPVYVSPDLAQISLSNFEGAKEIYPVTSSGQERTWKTKPETFQKALENGRIGASLNKSGTLEVSEKYYEHEKGQVIKTHWDDKRYHAIHHGTKLLEKIVGKGKFSYPKSQYLVEDILKLILPKDGLVIDFFAGSGTTGHAALALNKKDGGTRRFILCEQMEYAETVTAKRIEYALKENGNGAVYVAALCEKNASFVTAISNAANAHELNDIWKQISESGFLSHRVTREAVEAALGELTDIEVLRQALLACLDQNYLYVNGSEMRDATWQLDSAEIDLNNQIFGL